MVSVIVSVHLMIAVAMIALILLQKTEGNSAGGGFSVSSVTAMMQPRARANPLSRATTILGIAFFVSSMGLAVVSKQTGPARSILEAPTAASTAAPKVTDILPEQATDKAPAVPAEATSTESKPAAPPAVPTVPNN